MTEEFDMSDPKKDAPTTLTLLDKLREVASKRVAKPQFLIEVPERPGLAILIDPNIDDDRIKKLQSRVTHKGNMDTFRFGLLLVAETTRGLYLGGEEVTNDNGHPLTFVSPEVKDMFGGHADVAAVVKEMFGVDAHAISAAGVVIDRAGYGEDVEVEDPFQNS